MFTYRWGTERTLEAFTKSGHYLLTSNFSPSGPNLNLLRQIEQISLYEIAPKTANMTSQPVLSTVFLLIPWNFTATSCGLSKLIVHSSLQSVVSPEIISEIFMWSWGNCELEISFDHNHPMAVVSVTQTFDMYKNIRAILQVCWQWRGIGLGTPSLFTDIFLPSWCRGPCQHLTYGCPGSV